MTNFDQGSLMRSIDSQGETLHSSYDFLHLEEAGRFSTIDFCRKNSIDIIEVTNPYSDQNIEKIILKF